MTAVRILRAGPATTIQDAGRFGYLRHGISASGPMDAGAFGAAGRMLPVAGTAGIEFTRAGMEFTVDGPVTAAFAGGDFSLARNGTAVAWPAVLPLATGDRIAVTPGAAGNYGYVRFAAEIDVPVVLGSRATHLVAGLGGWKGRALRAGDVLPFTPLVDGIGRAGAPATEKSARDDGPIRILWGLHADLFTPGVRQAFLAATFTVSTRLDRMGVRLGDPAGVFAGAPVLSLVSDAIVPGDIQILGDGTPIVLMRDHQPTGGYPRIATVISADLDRLAQLRPGATLAFAPVTLHKAQDFLRDGRA